MKKLMMTIGGRAVRQRGLNRIECVKGHACELIRKT